MLTVLARITMTARQQLIIVMADIHAGHVRRITTMAVFLIHMTTRLRHASLTPRPPHLHLPHRRMTTKTAGGAIGQPRQIRTKLTVMIPIQLRLRLPGRRSTLLECLPRHPQIKISSQLVKCHHRHRQRR